MDAPVIELPEGFRDLEEHAVVWGHLRTQQERYLQRDRSDMADLKAFYDAVAPRLEEIFVHLDNYSRANLPAPQLRLFQTVMGLSEVGQAVEVFGEPGIPHARKQHDVVVSWVDRTPQRKSA